MSNARVMMSRNEVDELLDLHEAGWTVDELAEKFNCSRATVSVALGELLDTDADESDDEDPEDVDEGVDEDDAEDDDDPDDDEDECDEEGE